MRTEVGLVVAALDFAARRHSGQRRKGGDRAPYINHPVRVAYYLGVVAGIEDPELIAAAVLHDTVEDTNTGMDELRDVFGERVASLVAEVTDDKSLARETRKELQIEHAPNVSVDAAQLKIADKICNMEDLAETPPPDWSAARRREYLAWSERVVERLPDPRPELMAAYRRLLAHAREKLAAEEAGVS